MARFESKARLRKSKVHGRDVMDSIKQNQEGESGIYALRDQNTETVRVHLFSAVDSYLWQWKSHLPNMNWIEKGW